MGGHELICAELAASDAWRACVSPPWQATPQFRVIAIADRRYAQWLTQRRQMFQSQSERVSVAGVKAVAIIEKRFPEQSNRIRAQRGGHNGAPGDRFSHYDMRLFAEDLRSQPVPDEALEHCRRT